MRRSVFDQVLRSNHLGIGEIEGGLGFKKIGHRGFTHLVELAGEFPLIRAIPDSAGVCEDQIADNVEVEDINGGMDGAWYEPNMPVESIASRLPSASSTAPLAVFRPM